MQNFMLDESGDVIIKSGAIQMIDGNNLLLQTVRTVLGTNKKEWFLNKDEGINFKNILKKSPDMDIIRDEVLSGLIQVDSTFCLTSFEYEIVNRTLTVKFVARNAKGETISGGNDFSL